MKTEGGEMGGTGGNSSRRHVPFCALSEFRHVSVYFRHYHYETCQSLSITLSVSDIPFCNLSEFTLFSVCFRLQQFRD